MSKFQSLAKIHESIGITRAPVLNTLLFSDLTAAKRKRLVIEAGELTLLRAEIDGHKHALQLADLACEHGRAGTIPDRWEEWGGGEAYDPHQEVVDSLEWAPGRGAGMSPALLEYIDQLPQQSSQRFVDMLQQAQNAAPLLPAVTAEKITSGDAGQMGHGLYVESLQDTLFASSYADDLAQAMHLAKQKGDFEQISQLINCY
jgi:hypothetical protein